MEVSQFRKYLVLLASLAAIFCVPFAYSEDKNEQLRGKIRKLETSILDEVNETAKLLEDKNKLISQLQNKLKVSFQREEELTSQVDASNEEVYRLRKDANYTKGMLENRERELVQASDRVAVLEEENKVILQLQEKLKTASHAQERLGSGLEAANKEIYKLSQDVSYLTKDLEIKDRKLKEAEDKVYSLEEENKLIVQLKEQLRTVSIREKDLVAKVGQADRVMYQLNKDMGALRKENEIQVSELNDAETEIAQLKEENKVIFQLEEKLKASANKEEQLVLNTESLNKEIYRLDQDIKYLNKEVKTKNTELKEAKIQVQSLKDKNKQIFQLQEKLKAADQQLLELAEKLDQTNKEKYQLSKEVSYFKKEAQAKSKEIQEVVLREESLRQENKAIFQLQEKLEAASKEQKDLMLKLASADKENSRFNQDISYLRKEVEDKDALLKEKTAHLDRLKDENKVVFQLQEKVRTLVEKENELTISLDKANKEIDLARKDSSYYSKEARVKDRDLEQAYKKIQYLEEEGKRIFQFKEQLEAANQKETVLSFQAQKSDKVIEGLNAKVKELVQNLEDKSRKVKDTQELSRLLAEKNAVIFQMDEKLKASLQKEEELTAKLDEVSKDNYQLSRNVEHYSKELEVKDKKIDLFQRKVKGLDAESKALSQLQENLQESLSKKSDLEAMLKQADNKIYQLNQDVDYLKKELISRANELNAVKADRTILDGKEKTVSLLEHKVGQLLVREKELTSKLSDSDQQYNKLYAQLNDFKARLRDKDDVISRLQEKIAGKEEAVTLVSKQEETIKSLNKKLTVKNEEIDGLNKTIGEKSDLSRKRIQEIYKEIDSKDKEIAYLKGVIKQAIDKIKMLSGIGSESAELVASSDE